jgi:hypothetical protein
VEPIRLPNSEVPAKQINLTVTETPKLGTKKMQRGVFPPSAHGSGSPISLEDTYPRKARKEDRATRVEAIK